MIAYDIKAIDMSRFNEDLNFQIEVFLRLNPSINGTS